MSHNLNTHNGAVSYWGREGAWHSLGTVTGRYMTWSELCSQPGLDFRVFKWQLQDGLGRQIPRWGIFRLSSADYRLYSEALKASRRDPAELTRLLSQSRYLGDVGEDYHVIQHQNGFRTVDALMADRSPDGAHYETAGVLGAGETVWGSAYLGASMDLRVGEDASTTRLLFTTSHDGSGSYQFRLVSERVVCQNTLDIALSERSRACLKVRHTKGADAKITEIGRTLESLQSDVQRMSDRLNLLASKRMTRDSLQNVLDRLYPKTKEAPDGSGAKVSSTRRDNILTEILQAYEANDRGAFPEQSGTAYSLLNAITGRIDHQDGDGKAESAIFGAGSALKTKALEILLETAGTLPDAPRSFRVGFRASETPEPSQSALGAVLGAYDEDVEVPVLT